METQRPAAGGPSQAGGATALHRQAIATSQRTLEHLQAAVSITEDTQRVGESTLEELVRQGETIERTQRKVDELDAHADKAHFMLGSMKSLWGTFKSKFQKQPKDAKEAAEQAAAARAARRAKQAAAAGRPAPDPSSITAGGRVAAPASAATAEAHKPAAGTIAAAHAEQDALLDVISANVERIGQMGRALGDELTRQDGMLDDLVQSVDKADGKLKSNASTARKLAR